MTFVDPEILRPSGYITDVAKCAKTAGIRNSPGSENEAAESMAEGEGFEPPVPFQVQQFSRLPVSTAHTSLRHRF
jgi:hypothetical protein